MDDLTKRLAHQAFLSFGAHSTICGDLMREAANTIEALRTQLAKAEGRGAERILGHFLAALPLDRIVSAGGSVQDLIDGIKRVVQERDVARRAALEEAAKCCDDEADKCDDAVKWGGSKRYLQDCRAAAYAMRDRAAAIRALAKKP